MPRVKLTEPRFRKVAGVQLHPGLQSLNDTQFKLIKNHPAGLALFEKGILVDVDATTPALAQSTTVEDIADVYDVSRLKTLAQSRSKRVAAAAKAQLDMINARAVG